MTSVTEQRLVAALTGVAAEYANALRAAGRDLDDVGGEDVIVNRVRTALPRPNRFAARVGPVFTTGQLARLLPGLHAAPISDEAVRDRHRNGRLIGFKTADGRWAWPAWQFETALGRLAPRRDVIELWRLLPPDGPSELTRIGWLTGRHKDLEDATPLEWLARRGLDDALRSAAARWAAQVA